MTIHLPRAHVVWLAGVLALVGCYNPNIKQGGFACGAGGTCPENFHCAADQRCYQGDASVDVPNPVCTSMDSTKAVCEATYVGQACNPGCQSGCNGCGWCAIVDGQSKCLKGTEGSKVIGDTCDPAAQDCKAGLYCQPECGAGRCYQICDPSASVCGTNCTVPARQASGTLTSFSLCTLAQVSCDFVGQTGCQAPFACYPVGLATECDCPGTATVGEGCFTASQCVPGTFCIAASGMSSCFQACKSTSDCTSGGACDTTYNYCM